MNASTALVMIDWQEGFSELATRPGGRNNPHAERQAAQLLLHWRANGWPVVHVRHDSTVNGSVFQPTHPGNALLAFAQPWAGEAFHTKSVNSCFIGTTLEADLHARNIDTLVLTGVSSDHCLNTTARMGANLGFDMIIPADASYTFARAGIEGTLHAAELVHDVALASLAQEFAQITTTNAILVQALD